MKNISKPDDVSWSYHLGRFALLVLLGMALIILSAAYLTDLLDAMDNLKIKGQLIFTLSVVAITGLCGCVWAVKYVRGK